MVLLHGFPDSGRLWRHQVPALAEAGFQVIVPDLRGYGRSGKPRGRRGLRAPARWPGMSWRSWPSSAIARAHVVGHDWGAALAWGLASLAPGSVDHLAVLSVGHPATFRRTLEQREKSWYMLLFQFPGIAERWLTEDNWANFRSWARHPDADQVIAELEADRLAHARPELVPGQRPARVVGWVRRCSFRRCRHPPWACGARGDVALTEAQMTDSAAERGGPVAVRAAGRPGSLDAARRAGPGERAAARLPAPLARPGVRTVRRPCLPDVS